MRLIQNYGRRAKYVLSSEDPWLYTSNVPVQEFKEEENTQEDASMTDDDEKEALPPLPLHAPPKPADTRSREPTSDPSNPGKRLLDYIPAHVWNSSQNQSPVAPPHKRQKTGTDIQPRTNIAPHAMDFVYPEDMRAKIYDMLELKQWQDQHNIPHADYH